MVYLLAFLLILGVVLFYSFKRNFLFGRKSISRSAENAELIKVLLALEEQPLAELFKLYKKQFGEGAARYARQTYLKWKGGSVRPSKQTFNRFLINLPKVMSFDLKCEVLRELREKYCAQDNYNVTVYTDDWKNTLEPLVKNIINRTNTAELPENLRKRLAWLAEDDMQIANAILARSQTRQSLDALTLLEKEFSSIEQLLHNAGGKRKITHVVRLPLGTITLRIKRR